MQKLDMLTPDMVAQNLDQIAKLFPQVITEQEDADGNITKAIDYDLFRQMFSRELVEWSDERYRLDWPGKRASILKANTPINKTLRPVVADSVNWDTTENLYIEWDNFEVLKVLQESYLGKVKMIYIDPPYNTGTDFVYKDDFKVTQEKYEEWLEILDEEWGRLVKNTDTNGRFHSDWLSMMHERLLLARDLLQEDWLIFMSIDDNELTNLRKIADEIFGEENFIDNIIWKKRYWWWSKEKYLVSVHEYILMYAKSKDNISDIEIPLSEESIQRYYLKKDWNLELRWPFRTHPLEAWRAMDERLNLVFPIQAPDWTMVNPRRQWLWSKDKVEDAMKFWELDFQLTNNWWVISTKQYLKDRDWKMRETKAFSIIDDIYTQHGTNETISIFWDARIFSYPKPSEFIKKTTKFMKQERFKWFNCWFLFWFMI